MNFTEKKGLDLIKNRMLNRIILFFMILSFVYYVDNSLYISNYNYF